MTNKQIDVWSTIFLIGLLLLYIYKLLKGSN
jgi:cbb3-type cytochrome oxidase subunit 3